MMNTNERKISIPYPHVITSVEEYFFLPLVGFTTKLLDFLVEEIDSNYLEGLDAIILFDSILGDSFASSKNYVSSKYFPDGTHYAGWTELHIYAYESTLSTLNVCYPETLFGNIKKLLDIIYFFTHGHTYYEYSIISSLMYFRNIYNNLNETDDELAYNIKDLLLKYHISRYGKNARFKSESKYYLYLLRIHLAKKRKISWEQKIQEQEFQG